MLASLVRFSLVLALIGGLSGCALWRRPGEGRRRAALEKAQAAAKRRPVPVGRVVLVNADGGFALIDVAQGQVLPAGVTLRSYAPEGLSGEVRTTGVRRRPYFVADIVQGTPGRGDLIVQPAEAEPATPPRAEAIPPAVPAPAAQPLPLWRRWLSRLGLGK